MRHNPDFVWNQAENLAKNLVSGVQNLKEQNKSKDEIERYENNLKDITGECSKVQFMNILANAEKYIQKNDNVINCFIPQRDIKIDDSNYQTYITHVEDYKSYTLLNVKNSSQLVYFDYEELITRI